MRVAIVGSGYVGLVSGACLADFGHHVTCIDRDASRIEMVMRGEMPIFEPGLDDLVAKNREDGRLHFSTELAGPVREADVVLIAVGTPSRRGDGHADLSYVHSAAREIAYAMNGFTVVVTKSTVPVGTGDDVERIIRGVRPDAEFAVVSNPEFLREGAAIYDFKHPDRIVIGTDNPKAREVMQELYRPLFLNQAPILMMDRRSSELTKYAANGFLAVKISFINEIANLSEAVGADVQAVARGIGLDNRIGPKFLHPGPGFGGSCLPKDAMALLKTSQDHGVTLRVVENALAVNDTRKRAIARKIAAALDGVVRDRTIAVLGLAFKPNTDDMRDSPAIPVVTALQDWGAKVRAYDPESMKQAKPMLPDIEYAAGPYECAEGADAIVLLTEWEQFRGLDFERLKGIMKKPVLVDLRNVYRAEDVVKHGFAYTGIGRGDTTSGGRPLARPVAVA